MAKADVLLSPPLANASGSLGFAPDLHGALEWARFGAFFTNPISLAPRRPAATSDCLEFPGGFLLHSGYPNPGLRRVLEQYAPAWGRSSLPVIVSLLPQAMADVPQMLARLEGLPGVMGVELSLPPGVGRGALLELAQAAFGELAVILRLPVNEALELVGGADGAGLEPLLEAGLSAISLGAPRGALPQWINAQPRLVYGRLYGPHLFPQTLAAAHALAKIGAPLLAGPGVYTPGQARALLDCGVLAVQLDALLWRDPALSGWEGF